MKTIKAIIIKQFYVFTLLLLSIHSNLMAQSFFENNGLQGEDAQGMFKTPVGRMVGYGSGTASSGSNEKNEKRVQRRGDIKGPNAKNHKQGIYQSSSVIHAKNMVFPIVKGPDAKNYQPWKEAEGQQTVQLMLRNREGMQLQGPKAKNL